MGLVVPKVLKHLSGDTLFGSLRTVFADIADRQGDSDIPLSDALMSAFAMFSLKSPRCSPLIRRGPKTTCNGFTASGGYRAIPRCADTRSGRAESLRPAFKAVFVSSNAAKPLKRFCRKV